MRRIAAVLSLVLLAVLLFWTFGEDGARDSERALARSAEAMYPDASAAREPRDPAPLVRREELVASPTSGDAAHVIEGEVLGPQGDPLAGARVALFVDSECDASIARTSADELGRFAFAEVHLQRAWVLAEAEGMTSARVSAGFLGDTTRTFVRLRLWDASELFGRVTDADGTPVAGAEVAAGTETWDSFNVRPAQTSTDASGAFRLTGLPTGTFALRVRAPGFAMAERSGFLDGATRADVELARSGGVQITAVIEGWPADLEPTPALQVFPLGAHGGFGVPTSLEGLRFDRRGELVLEGLLEGEWVVRRPVLEGWRFEPELLRLPLGEGEYRAVFRAQRCERTALRGRLRRSDGAPLAGEMLVCFLARGAFPDGSAQPRATTDAEGRFEIVAPLAPGEPFLLALRRSRYALAQPKSEGHRGHYDPSFHARYEGSASSEEIELLAVESARASGHIVDTEGTPVPLQLMELAQKQERVRWSIVAYAQSAGDGSFAFRGVLPSDRPLQIVAKGSHGSTSLELAPGQSLEGIVVTVPKPGSVNGTALDASGAPLAGMLASLERIDLATQERQPEVPLHALTDRAGRYRFPLVAPGGCRVRLPRGRQDTLAQTEAFEVRTGEEARIDVRVAADERPRTR